MIPLQLSLRNFLCYREGLPPLDLRGVHVACLCGGNGHGKSALLDAMTWCLWGMARTGARSYDALIAYGAAECRVELDFMAQGQTYRVIRRRRSGGRGRTEADLFILDDAELPRAITGNTLGETDARIRRIVGMDYATFVNSAFLAQGRADEFTGKTAAQRKDVLSSILGLELYDILLEAARGQRVQWQDKATRAGGALGQAQAALDAIADPAAELARIGARLGELDGEIATAAGDAERQRAIVAELWGKRDAIAAAVRRIAELGEDAEQAERAIAAIAERIANYQELAERADAIVAGARRLDAARQELHRQETARQEYDRLRERRLALQRAIERQQAALAAETAELRRRIEEELAPAASGAGRIGEELAALAGAEMGLQSEQEDIGEEAARAAELQREIATDRAALERCVSEGKELRARQQDMQSANAACPLCLTPLSEDTCGNIKEYYATEIAAKLRQHSVLQRNIREMEQEYAGSNAAIEGRRQGLEERRRQAQRERARLEQARQQAAIAGEQLGQLQPRLAAQQQALASGDFASRERGELADTDGAMARLGYDEKARADAFRRTQELQRWERELREWETARERLPADEAEMRRNENLAARRRAEMEEAEAALAADQAAVAGLPAQERAAATAAARHSALARERDELLAQQGRLQGDAERRAQHQADMERLAGEHQAAQSEQRIYDELTDAFGRSGVPALLIDAAVPQIENEANRLLGRMTDQRLAVKLETQRLNQGGKVTETLDILISDELGSRSYELFSGGEAFRINLALRIALSKTLSRRLGFPLPTLFIDEGFGTQDAAGRERIVDAIASIQQEFEKIIVITHLDDLKDLFPVRIEVLKTDAGSQYWLS